MTYSEATLSFRDFGVPRFCANPTARTPPQKWSRFSELSVGISYVLSCKAAESVFKLKGCFNFSKRLLNFLGDFPKGKKVNVYCCGWCGKGVISEVARHMIGPRRQFDVLLSASSLVPRHTTPIT